MAQGNPSHDGWRSSHGKGFMVSKETVTKGIVYHLPFLVYVGMLFKKFKNFTADFEKEFFDFFVGNGF